MKNRNSYYNQPLYAIFKRDKEGRLLGYVENSFCMSWDLERVRVWPSNDSGYDLVSKGDMRRILPWMDRKTKKNKEGIFVVRLRSAKCPVDVKFDNIPIDSKDYRKYNFRNKVFKLKDNAKITNQ